MELLHIELGKVFWNLRGIGYIWKRKTEKDGIVYMREISHNQVMLVILMLATS